MADGFQSGSAWVDVLPSLRGFQTKIKADVKKMFATGLDVKVTPDLDTGAGQQAKATAAAKTLGRTVPFKVDLDKKSLTDSIVGVAALGRAMGTLALPGAAVAVTPYLLSVASAASQAGGAVALLPALGFAAAAGIGALALGARGYSDAISETDPEKYAEAVAKLAPAARETANEVKALAPAWKTMQLHVQQQLFEGISTRVRELSGAYLPVLNTQLGNLAARYNLAAQKSVNVLLEPRSIADTTLGLTNLNTATGNAALAAGPLTAAFRDLGVVGSTFLPAMGVSVANLSTRFAGFIAHARETGQIRVWIQSGLDTLRLFGSVTTNVGRIVGSALDAARGSGENFLVVIDRFTGRIADALRTPEGASGLTQFFTGVRTVVSGLVDRLVQLWPVVTAGAGAFLALSTQVQPFADVLFDLVATVLPPLLNLIGALAPILGPMLATIVGLRIAVAGWAAAQWVLNAAMTANPIGVVIVALAGLVAGLVWAYKSSETFRNIVTTALNVVGDVAMYLWRGVFEPVFKAIGAVISLWWTVWGKPIFDAFVYLIRNVVIPVLNWMKDRFVDNMTTAGHVIATVWRSVIKPTFDFLTDGLRWLSDNFVRTVDRIKDVWGRLRPYLAKPINFMIGVVWNEGIRKAWNLVAGLLPGIDPIAPLPLIREMAEGGRITGGVPGKDSVPIMAMHDEFVVRRKYAKPGREFLEAFNAGQPEALQAAGLIRFAQGGPVEAMRNVDRVMRTMHGTPYVWGGNSRFGTDCSGAVAFAARAARMEANPYRRIGTTSDFPWGGFRPGLHSAFGVGNVPGSHMRATIGGRNLESGGAHNFFAWGPPAAGVPYGTNHHLPSVGGQFVPGGGGGFVEWVKDQIRGWVRDIVDPTIGRLPHPPPAFKGLPRKAAVKVRDTSLDWFLGQADNGAWLPPGWSTIYNGTGRDEAILTHRQLTDALSGGGGGVQNTWHIHEANDPAETAVKIARRQEMAGRTGAPL